MNIQALNQILSIANPGYATQETTVPEPPVVAPDWSWSHRSTQQRESELPPAGWDRRRNQPALRRHWLFRS